MLAGLGWNTRTIPDLAVVVRDELERADLTDVTVIAHRKGGLIAKHAIGRPGHFRPLAAPATLRLITEILDRPTPGGAGPPILGTTPRTVEDEAPEELGAPG